MMKISSVLMKGTAKEIAQVINPFKHDGKEADNHRKLFERIHNQYYDNGRVGLLQAAE